MDEIGFDLAPARHLRAVDADRWLGRPGRAYWCEWSHPSESSRTLSSMIEHLEDLHWPRFVRPGSVVIDVGGHSGDTAIPLGLFAYDREKGRPGTVIVAEPNPDVLRVMDINLALNAHVATFKSAPYAITETDIDEIELSDHGNANCNGGIVDSDRYSTGLNDRLSAVSGVRYKARGVTFPTLLRESGIDDFSRVSFIKTDCEGYDKEILRGASAFLQAYKPALFVEWFAWFSPEDDVDFLSAISEIGYIPYNPTTLQQLGVGERLPDVLCLPKK